MRLILLGLWPPFTSLRPRGVALKNYVLDRKLPTSIRITGCDDVRRNKLGGSDPGKKRIQ